MHLLTKEAMRTYLRHLKKDGVIIFNISNNHLDLEPVVRALAESFGLTAVMAPPVFVDVREGKLSSAWMILSANSHFFEEPAMAELLSAYRLRSKRPPILWTDDYSSILPILH
jgi:hypothetical protein